MTGLVSRSADCSVCQKFLNGRYVTLPCSYLIALVLSGRNCPAISNFYLMLHVFSDISDFYSSDERVFVMDVFLDARASP